MIKKGHSISLLHDRGELRGGDILFLVSCSQVLREEERTKYRAVLVLHASDLPRGRGWSPHIWSILNGENEITVTLLAASEPVDTGAIYIQTRFTLEGHELLVEINAKLFEAELSLMTQAVERLHNIQPIPQSGDCGSYMRKRFPADSRLDPHKTIVEQFDLLRIADSDRHPAFFDYRGKRYLLKIEKDDRNVS
jgi:methionyl-tRNA formyltransferase